MEEEERPASPQEPGQPTDGSSDDSNRSSIALWVFFRKRPVRVCLILLMFLGSLSLLTGYGDSMSESARSKMQVLAAFFTIGSLVVYSFAFYWAPLKVRSRLKPAPLPADRALKLQKLVSSKRILDAHQAQVFALSVTDPAAVRTRVTERYEPGRRTLQQHVAVEFQLSKRVRPQEPSGSSSPAQGFLKEFLYIPVLIPPKGELLDNLVVRDSSGALQPCLTYSEYLRVAAATLHMLLASAYRLNAKDELGRDAAFAEFVAIEAMIRRFDPNLSRTKDDEGSDQGSAADIIAKLHAPYEKALKVAASFVSRLTDNYAMVAVVPHSPSGRFLLTYERILIPRLRLTKFKESAYLWAKDRLQMLLGARPVDLTISIGNAWTCQSFHLRFYSSDDLYLASQHPLNFRSYLSRWARGAPAPPYFRIPPRLGQPHAHFYSRFFSEPEKGEPKPGLRLKFFEVPPGSVFRAAVAAIACFFLVLIVGYLASRSKPETDAPAFLLAFPALAATWLGFDAPSRRLLEGTLVARLSLICTIATSVAASGLFIAYRSGLHLYLFGAPLAKLPKNLQLLGVHQIDWALLLLVTLINAACTSYICIMRSYQFTYLSSRPPLFSGSQQHG